MTSSNVHGVSISYSYDDPNRLVSVADSNLAGSNTASYITPQSMRCVPQRCHTGKGGLHPSGRNPLWDSFIGQPGNPSTCPSVQSILNFMSQMEQQFAAQFNCD
jgi:hypothetical protein